LTKDEVIVEIRSGVKPSVADLMARSGMSRGTIRGLVNQWSPTDKINIPRPRRPKEMVNQPAEPEPRLFRYLGMVLHGIPTALIVIPALAMGGVGMWWNFQYWYAFGGGAFGILGGSIDSVTVFLPVKLRRRWSHIPLFLLWLLCAGLSGIAELGSTANRIDDGLQERGSIPKQREALVEQQKHAEATRKGITELGDVNILENHMNLALGMIPMKNRKSSNDCNAPTPNFSAEICQDYNARKDRYIAARSRDDLDAKIASLAKQIAALPPIASEDPSADHMSRLTLGRIEPGMVQTFRVIGFAAMPILAGVLMAFARTR
jgi:hypothetical protein